MIIKAPTGNFPLIPYRKTTEIDCDSLDFALRESVEKPDAMEQRRNSRKRTPF